MYKKITMALALLLSGASNSYALECKFVADQMKSIVRYTDTSVVVSSVDDINIRLEKLIQMCGAKAHKVKHAEIPQIEIFNKKANNKNCNRTIVKKQTENAERAVGVQVGRVRDAVKTASKNTAILEKILADCIKSR
ncbi:MAG: hypothetical protein OEX03_04535 [Gammaproteobacteria bacterium]|nr:hypothetical protein [Gammaproteobacteria bacterium]